MIEIGVYIKNGVQPRRNAFRRVISPPICLRTKYFNIYVWYVFFLYERNCLFFEGMKNMPAGPFLHGLCLRFWDLLFCVFRRVCNFGPYGTRKREREREREVLGSGCERWHREGRAREDPWRFCALHCAPILSGV